MVGDPTLTDERCSRYIRLYQRFTDDLFLIWTGPAAVPCEIRHALVIANEAISLDWSGHGSQQNTANSRGGVV